MKIVRANIPARKIVINPRKQPRLRNAQEEPRRRQPREVMHKSHARHAYPPEDHSDSQEDLCAEQLEHDVGGGLEAGVGDEE